MKPRAKKIAASLLVVIICMLIFDYLGIIKPQEAEGNSVSEEISAQSVEDYSLGAGDWLYLDISGFTSWADTNAKLVLYYQKSDSSWGEVQMEECGDYLYRGKIPSDVSTSGQFKFKRVNPSDDTVVWNWVPSGTTNLVLSDSESNKSNTYGVTGWEAGNWMSNTWNISNYGGEILYFMNMDGVSVDGLTAVFSVSGSTDIASVSSVMTAVSTVDGLYQVTIPDAYDYDTVQFADSNGNVLATENILDGSYNPDSENTYYYRRTVISDTDFVSNWDVYPTGTQSISGSKLYLDQWNFSVESVTTIRIGNGTEITLTPDADDTTIYSYEIPADAGATQTTIITIKADGTTYHFLWSDLTKNVVTFGEKDILAVADTYSSSASGTRNIYFDATLSKLSYVGDAGDIGMPLAGQEVVYYYAWSETTGANTGGIVAMTKVSAKTIGENTWSDIYKAEIDSAYDHILFCSSAAAFSASTVKGTKTVDLTIPTDLKNPCFYADSSDAIAYDGGKRDGYWDEVYKIRDAESGKTGSDVVDISSGTFSYDSSVLYLKTTLYDYYSDYELNGYNRDSYNSSATITSHRIYQQFRQFNQALSDYYEDNSATWALYWGNAQNYSGSHFTEISDTLNLYGFDKSSSSQLYKRFFYVNNSMWGIDGAEIKQGGLNATIGLISDTLSDGSLMLETSGGTAVAPFFDESFLSGNNAKNTVLGEVYHDVTFPFVKKAMTSNSDTSATGTVDYWYFNSADTSVANKNLQLKYDEDRGYYLESQSSVIKGEVSSGSATADGNYLPFNTTGQSANASLLNYGFGQKIEFSFRLTEDGTVLTTNDESVPIEFNFWGDDDVWVFIDGELVLDVGGAHGAVSGRINFKDRNVYVSKVKNTDSGGYTSDYTVSFPASLASDTDFYKKEHTLTMFYMERGLWESNMMITFNFPDENKLSIEKEVDTTSVNDMFKDLFNDSSVFQFTIMNQATHYGSKAVSTGDEAKPVTYNDTFTGRVYPSVSSNLFTYVSTYAGRSDVVHWYAKLTDSGGVYKDLRWGIIQPANGDTIDVSEQSAYLQFKVYYDETDTPQLNYMRLELEDANGKVIGGALNGKTYGNSTVKSKTWTTLQIELSKLTGDAAFDFSQVKYIKFDYDYPCDFYLDDFIFKPATSATTLVGFVMQQQDIPDYGSATSGQLENAVGALFSTTDDNGNVSYGRVDENGNFALENGQRIVFSNQFRRGSYIYIKENIHDDVFDVSWKLYENGQEITDTTVPSGTATVQGGGTITNDGTAIGDLRQEIYSGATDENGISMGNTGYTKTGWAKLDGEDTTDTIVFRSYAYPDSETAGLDLLIKQINTVKTGALQISKEAAEGSQDLDGEYTIRIVFSNIAGMALESEEIVYDVTLKAGETKLITGIPAGTIYTITEIFTEEDLKLEEIKQMTGDDGTTVIGNDHVLIDGTTSVQGVIVADEVEDETTATGFTFVNSLTPSISLNLKKLWKASDGTTDLTEGIPSSIWVQVQRKASDETEFSPVDVPGSTDGCIELTPGYEGWTIQITGLEKYKDNVSDNPYTYRVVEMIENEDGTFSEAGDSFIFDGIELAVDYSGDIVLSSTTTTREYDYTITNRKIDTFDFSFTKVKGFGDSITKLSGAEFTLYEYKGTESLDTYSEVMESINDSNSSSLWVEHNLQESSDNPGVFTQSGLPREHVYYLVETKVPDGMQTPGGCWMVQFDVNTESSTDIYNHVKITALPESGDTGTMPAIGIMSTATNNIQGWFITNLEQWDVPSTGGLGNNYSYIVGFALMLVAVVCGAILTYRNRKGKRARKT